MFQPEINKKNRNSRSKSVKEGNLSEKGREWNYQVEESVFKRLSQDVNRRKKSIEKKRDE